MLSVSGAKGDTAFYCGGCDQGIGELNAVGESVLFNKYEGRGADHL